MPSIERLPTDNAKSYAALCDYAALGPGRSLEKLVQIWTRSGLADKPTRWLSTLKRWSSAQRWALRCDAYDQQAQVELEQQRAVVRAARRAELEDSDWQQGAALREAAAALLAEVPRFLRRTTNRV